MVISAPVMIERNETDPFCSIGIWRFFRDEYIVTLGKLSHRAEAVLLGSFSFAKLKWSSFSLKNYLWLGTVTCTCSPSYSRVWGRRLAWTYEFKTSLGNIARPVSKQQQIIFKEQEESLSIPQLLSIYSVWNVCPSLFTQHCWNEGLGNGNG